MEAQPSASPTAVKFLVNPPTTKLLSSIICHLQGIRCRVTGIRSSARCPPALPRATSLLDPFWRYPI